MSAVKLFGTRTAPISERREQHDDDEDDDDDGDDDDDDDGDDDDHWTICEFWNILRLTHSPLPRHLYELIKINSRER